LGLSGVPILGNYINFNGENMTEFNQEKYLKKCLKEARGKVASCYMADVDPILLKHAEDTAIRLARALSDLQDGIEVDAEIKEQQKLIEDAEKWYQEQNARR